MAKPKPILLKVIPEPSSNARTVFAYHGTGTVAMSGEDPLAPDICCGWCGAPLARSLPRQQLGNRVLQCNGCGAFNDPLELVVT